MKLPQFQTGSCFVTGWKKAAGCRSSEAATFLGPVGGKKILGMRLKELGTPSKKNRIFHDIVQKGG